MTDTPLIVLKEYQNVPTVQITGFTEEQKVSFLSPWDSNVKAFPLKHHQELYLR